MLGVDVVDKLITYYRPQLWCQRTWMPIVPHWLDILQVNLYVLYKDTSSYNHPDVDNDTIWNHKHFLIEFVNSLIHRSNAETRCGPVVTRGVATHKDPAIVHKGTTSELVMSRKNPSLSIFDDLRYCPGVNKLVPASKQRKCKYCQYLVLIMKNRRKETTLVAEKRPWLQCNICNLYLYKLQRSFWCIS